MTPGVRVLFAFCERVTATPTSPEHIRRVGIEGLKHGGGAPDTTLCERPLHRGWDLERRVTVDEVRRLAGAQYENGAFMLCPDCSSRFLSSQT